MDTATKTGVGLELYWIPCRYGGEDAPRRFSSYPPRRGILESADQPFRRRSGQ